MAEPTTSNVALVIPNTGDLVGTWGSAALNPDFAALDGFLGGVQIISASNANIILTAPSGSITPSGGPTQAQNAVLRFTGVLTGNVQVMLPLPGYIIIENLTTGAFVLSFAAAASGQIIGIEQGVTQRIYNDGTNVRFVNLPTVGSYLDICDATVPAWITACTVPPYLNCDGTTFNATTYPYLNNKLGGNTLPDLRGVTRYTLNQGTSRLTNAVCGLDGNTRFSIKTSQTNTILATNLPPYTPTGTIASTGTAQISEGAVNGSPTTQLVYEPGGTSGTATLPLTIVSDFIGNPTTGASTPIGSVATGTISGITLIRAA